MKKIKIGNFYLLKDRANFILVEITQTESFEEKIRWEMIITPSQIFLFLSTLLTTTAMGAIMQGFSPLSKDIVKGFIFSLPLIFILASHELGHILAMRKYGIRSSFPYFIPAPNIIGTFGAIMILREKINESSKILKIGAWGPIAGFIAAIPVSIIGLNLSSIVEASAQQEGMIKLGSPILFSVMEKIIFKVPDGSDLLLHPIAFAGWIGFFVTAINLIPVGQTDGGHIVFSIIPHFHRAISLITSLSLVIFGLIFWYGWIIWGILTLILGIRSIPYLPHQDIGKNEKIIAIISLLIFILSFTIAPIEIKY